MDASELVPGLCRMLEERMGPRLGRFVTTALLLVIVFAIFVWCFRVINQGVFEPLWNLIEKGYGWDIAYSVMRLALTGAAMILIMWLVGKWSQFRLRRHFQEHKRECEEFFKEQKRFVDNTWAELQAELQKGKERERSGPLPADRQGNGGCL